MLKFKSALSHPELSKTIVIVRIITKSITKIHECHRVVNKLGNMCVEVSKEKGV